MATAASDRPVHASLDTLNHEEQQQRDADDHGIKQISGGGVAETPDGGMKENQKESTATAIVPIKTQKTHMMLRGYVCGHRLVRAPARLDGTGSAVRCCHHAMHYNSPCAVCARATGWWW